MSVALPVAPGAAAMFLILELDTPYHGVIRISDLPLRLAAEQIGH